MKRCCFLLFYITELFYQLMRYSTFKVFCLGCFVKYLFSSYQCKGRKQFLDTIKKREIKEVEYLPLPEVLPCCEDSLPVRDR